MPEAQNISLVSMIPQKPPMVMVGEHVSTNGNKTISSFEIEADNIFCEDGLFTEPGLIEHMAQTAALRMGYLAAKNSSGATKQSGVGYIGAIKNLVIFKLPKVGQTILTELSVEREIMDFLVVKTKVTSEGQPIAECEMKIFQEKN